MNKHFIFICFFPMLLFIGYLLTLSYFSDFIISYTFFSLIAIFSSFLLLTKLNSFSKPLLPIWLIFLYLFFFYQIKFYYLIIGVDDDVISKTIGGIFLPAFRDVNVLFSSFITNALAFTVFCISSWIYISFFKYQKKIQIKKSDIILSYRNLKFIKRLLLLAVVLFILTSYIMYKTQMGVLGIEPLHMPFKIEGIIISIRNILIPSIFSLSLWLSAKQSYSKYTKITIILFALHSIVDTFLRGTKGSSIANMIICVTLLMLIARIEITFKNKILLLSMALIAILVFPLMRIYRGLRIEDADMVFSKDILLKTFYNFKDIPLVELLVDALQSIFLRFAGSDMTIIFNYVNVQPLLLSPHTTFNMLLFNKLGHFITYLLFGEWSSTTVILPGIVGWFYLLGGNIFVVFGFSLIPLVVLIFWQKLSNMNLYILPIVQLIFAGLLLNILSSGGIEQIIQLKFLAYPASTIFLETMSRKYLYIRVQKYRKEINKYV